jgi:uncharacterized protein with PhoU and TrkA domain
MGPLEGDVSSRSIDYEPVSVKDVLVEMKDTSELLIDLAYSAVLHQSEAVAREVLTLEEKMDVLQMRARMSLMMAARNPSDTEQLAPVLGVVGGAQKISDAAGDVAKIVIEEMGLPDAMRAAIPEAVEMLVRGTVEDGSEYAGRTLGDVNLESRTGVRVIAIRRGPEWILHPGPASTQTTSPSCEGPSSRSATCTRRSPANCTNRQRSTNQASTTSIGRSTRSST